MQEVDLSVTEFFEQIQRIIGRMIISEPVQINDVENLCGLDVSYGGEEAVAAAALWSISHRRVIEKAEYRGKPSFPYVPGLLFIREAPLMLAALRGLQRKPNLILVDGHGIAHPRGAGVAVFIGLLSNTPTIGVAKSILVGVLGESVGPFKPILIGDLKVGYAYSTETGRIFYMSPGHRVRVEDIIEIVQRIGFTYPQPLKEAHRISKDRIKNDK